MTALRALATVLVAGLLSTPAHALDVTPALAGLCEVADAGDATLEQRLAEQADDPAGRAELETQLTDMVTRHVTGHTVVSVLRLQAHCRTLLDTAPDDPDGSRADLAETLRTFEGAHARVCSAPQWQAWRDRLAAQPDTAPIAEMPPTVLPDGLAECRAALLTQGELLERGIPMLVEDARVGQLWQRDGAPDAQRRTIGIQLNGARVGGVLPGRSAARAGLAADDLILAIDGVPVWGELGILHALHVATGDRVRMEVRRIDVMRGQVTQHAFDVVLEDAPPAGASD